MAINTPEENNVGNQSTNQQSANTQGGSTMSQQPNQKPVNIASLVTTFGGSTHVFNADGEVQKVQKTAQEYFDKNAADAELQKYRAIPVSSKQTGSFGALVIATKRIINNNPFIFYSTMIVEKTRGPLDPQIMPINGTSVEIIVTPGDVWGDHYINVISEEMRRAFGDAAARPIQCGYQIVTDNTNIVDLDVFTPMIDEAINAIDNAADTANPSRDVFSIGLLTSNQNLRLRSRVSIDQPKTQPNGLPVRDDIRTELLVSQVNSNRSLIAENSEQRLFGTSAYVDLIYTPPQTQSYFGAAQQQFNPNQKYYVPRITLTNLSVDLPLSGLEFMLLGISSTAALARNRAYGSVWRNHFGTNANQYRDFGAVGYQVPLLVDPSTNQRVFGKIDTAGDVKELIALLNTVVHDSPIYTIELEQGGQGNWVSSVFARAAGNGKESVAANQLIIKAADNLTNQNFSRIFNSLTGGQGGAIITTTGDDMSFTGTYVRDGEYRDIRELDLLAILNIVGGKDMDLVNAFISTFNPAEPVQVRLQRRRHILERVGKDVKIKGYARKFDFTGHFIEALAQAIAACGLVINNDSLIANPADNVFTQTLQTYQQNMVNPTHVNSLFASAAPTNQFQSSFQVGNIFGGGYGY